MLFVYIDTKIPHIDFHQRLDKKNSKFIIDKMMREAKGATQKFVGLGYIRDFKIKLPKLSEQKSIVKNLMSFRRRRKN